MTGITQIYFIVNIEAQEQLQKEIIILSQMDHVNIVKYCKLEVKIPRKSCFFENVHAKSMK